jgi:hypothetical protein
LIGQQQNIEEESCCRILNMHGNYKILKGRRGQQNIGRGTTYRTVFFFNGKRIAANYG